MSFMFGLPFQHCDDVMAAERYSVVETKSGGRLSGWLVVPGSESPEASSATCWLGADVRHVEHGSEPDITGTRVDALARMLLGRLKIS